MVVEGVDLQVETRRQRGELMSGEVLVISVRPKAAGAGPSLVVQGPPPRLWTAGMGCAGGGLWMWTRPSATCKAVHRGPSATSMGWWSPMWRDHFRAPNTPTCSRTPARG